MQNNLSLEAYYQQYVQGRLSKKQLEGIIFQFVLKNYKRFHLYNWSKEDCIDYLCWLYPRIGRTIDRYRFCGSSFDGYIRSLIHWSSKEYRVKESNKRFMENAYWDTTAAEMVVCSQEPEYSEPDHAEADQSETDYAEAERALKPVSNPRQILVLLLKSYYHVSEDFIGRIAPAIGIEKEKLILMIETLRKRRYERDEHVRHLRERLHGQYYRCISFERRLSTVTEGSSREALIRYGLEKSRLRIKALRKRLKSIRLDATNRQVAEILGVPKGTVDSSLFALKSRQKNPALRAAEEPGAANRVFETGGPADYCFGMN
ncbi:MAG: hypothetical protein LBU21_01705 [Treponema sp.]|jgi:DNA-directed RNA polymerase specialized sigma24 family protein|nr:hypothetical protein [Treponema sp.]